MNVKNNDKWKIEEIYLQLLSQMVSFLQEFLQNQQKTNNPKEKWAVCILSLTLKYF